MGYSYWHFGIVKHDKNLFSVGEVYFSEGSDKPHSWAKTSLSDLESPASVEWNLEKMQADIDKYPVYNYPEDFEMEDQVYGD